MALQGDEGVYSPRVGRQDRRRPSGANAGRAQISVALVPVPIFATSIKFPGFPTWIALATIVAALELIALATIVVAPIAFRIRRRRSSVHLVDLRSEQVDQRQPWNPTPVWGTVYWAQCSCGWRSRRTIILRNAKRWGRRHGELRD